MKISTGATLFARRALVGALALSLLAGPLPATWSIVVVNTKTREVAVGTATCLSNFDIQKAVPVIVPEHGGAAAQSAIDSSGLFRKRMRRGLLSDFPPADILAHLQTISSYQQRQFGIVGMYDDPVTFTGTNVGKAKGGVAGTAGDLRYAIQGNVLTGPEVWLAAETALVNTPGDLSQKLMAAMEAARSMGGDGRCSCLTGPPDSCGAPPTGGFQKSAHCGFVGVARVGDSLGLCTSTAGCAKGKYFLSLNNKGDVNDPDPVFVLQGEYDVWRLAQAGRPDQVHSDVTSSAQALVADGLSSTILTVRLVDIEGVPLTTGGLALEAFRMNPGPGVTTGGPVLDHGDGTYSFPVQAGTTPGTDVWRVRVTDAVGEVVLQPDVTVPVEPLTPLHLGAKTVSAAQGGQVPFTLNLGPGEAGASYRVLGSASGTSPGIPFQGVHLPLNLDKLLVTTIEQPYSPLFDHIHGVLDADGRAEASFLPPPDLLSVFAGTQLDWAAVVFGPVPSVHGPVGLTVTP